MCMIGGKMAINALINTRFYTWLDQNLPLWPLSPIDQSPAILIDTHNDVLSGVVLQQHKLAL